MDRPTDDKKTLEQVFADAYTAAHELAFKETPFHFDSHGYAGGTITPKLNHAGLEAVALAATQPLREALDEAEKALENIIFPTCVPADMMNCWLSTLTFSPSVRGADLDKQLKQRISALSKIKSVKGESEVLPDTEMDCPDRIDMGHGTELLKTEDDL